MGPAGLPDPLGLSSGEKRKASGLGVLAGVIERMLTVEVPEGEALGLGIPLGGSPTHTGGASPGCLGQSCRGVCGQGADLFLVSVI